MFKRLYRYLRSLFMRKMDQLEDPEVLIDSAVQDIMETHAKNKERAVQAITQRNQLQNMVDQEEKKARDLEAKATMALQSGNRELARTLLREKGISDQTLTQLRASMKQAQDVAEAVKTAIRRDEERINAKKAEAHSLKAQMKLAQMQNDINKALHGFELQDVEQSFGRAADRITAMRSEADARAEIANTSVNARLAELSDQQVDVEADQALLELERKLGLAPAAAPVAASGAATPQQEDDIDRQLKELEQKLGQQ